MQMNPRVLETICENVVRTKNDALGSFTCRNTLRCCRVFVYPSLTPVKDQELVILGSEMHSTSFSAALHGVLRTLIDDLGSQTFNIVIFGMHVAPRTPEASSAPSDELQSGLLESESSVEGAQGEGAAWSALVRPVVARIVVRGPANAKASDFGALEVLCGASIGRTDPYRMHEALQRRFG